VRRCPKKCFFKRKPHQQVWKKCVSEKDNVVCIGREFLEYNRFPLICEVRRETYGQNTLQYPYKLDDTELRDPSTIVREVLSAKQ
jgi:hypothetical protein